METSQKLSELEEILGIRFKDKTILRQALTHSSKASEEGDLSKSYERLEFLGDSVFNLSVTDFIYLSYPDLTEGMLAKFRAEVVNARNLAAIGKRLNIGRFLMFGKGAGGDGLTRKESVIADSMEAVIGAIYLDQGPEAARKFVLDNFGESISKIRHKIGISDYKTRLQEVTLKIDRTTPVYKVASEQGPPHEKTFEVEVSAMDKKEKGSGPSKKEAQQAAAKKLLKKLTGKG